MSTRSQRTLAVVTGAGAATASLGASLVGLAAPAGAVPVPDYTTCNANSVVANDGTVNSALAKKNAAALAAFKKTPAFKKVAANTAAKAAALVKAKKTKNKAKIAAATKAYNAAVAAQGKAVANFVKANYVSSSSGTSVPAAVSPSGSVDFVGAWTWGKYTTRVYVKGGAMIGVCNNVNEDVNAENTSHVTAHSVDPTDAWKTTSYDSYQSVSIPIMLQAAQGKTGSFTGAATKGKILPRVHTLIVDTTNGFSGAASPLGAGSGATYSVQGFYNSLQAALIKSKLN